MRGIVTNIFNNDAVIFPDTTVITRRSGGAGSNLVAFNPLTDVPIECTERDPANPNRCNVSGANWMRGLPSARRTASAPTTTRPGSAGAPAAHVRIHSRLPVLIRSFSRKKGRRRPLFLCPVAYST